MNEVAAFQCRTNYNQIFGGGVIAEVDVGIQLSPQVMPGGNLVVDLSKEIQCVEQSIPGSGSQDETRVVNGGGFNNALSGFNGWLTFYSDPPYPFPLTSPTRYAPIGPFNVWMPWPVKIYLSPIGGAGGIILRSGQNFASVVLEKRNINPSTGFLGQPDKMTWNLYSLNDVVMPVGGCDVSTRNVSVTLPAYDATSSQTVPVPLTVNCPSGNKTLSYTLDGTTVDASRQIFRNSAASSPAYGIGINMLDKNNNAITANNPVLLGTVGASSVDLQLKARYARTGDPVTAGTVQSIIGVTFTYP